MIGLVTQRYFLVKFHLRLISMSLRGLIMACVPFHFFGISQLVAGETCIREESKSGHWMCVEMMIKWVIAELTGR